jgi:anti-sigma regulatory factor (Ser/Thr protein kinase)
VELPASAAAVEQFSMEFRSRYPAVCRLAFPAELLLREALANSLEHGCQNDPAKRILCAVRAKRGRLLIVVGDEGEGFDWRAAMLRRSAVNVSGGRGIEIFRRYASRFRYNAKGNAVALLMRFQDETRG